MINRPLLQVWTINFSKIFYKLFKVQLAYSRNLYVLVLMLIINASILINILAWNSFLSAKY